MAPGPLLRLEDPGDPRLAVYAGLAGGPARARAEIDAGVLVAEGRLAAEALVASPLQVLSLLVADTRVGPAATLVAAVRATGAPVFVAPAATIAATVGFDLHRGIVAAGRRPDPVEPDVLLAGLGPEATVVVLEGVNDHENLGSLFRTAAGLGASAVLADPTCADPWYRRSIRVSLGHALRMPFARLPGLPGGLEVLRAAGCTTVALSPAGTVDVAALVPAGRTALLVGAEGPGLSAAVLAGADVTARIAMADGVDSLNVAVAAGVALHRLVGIPTGGRRRSPPA